MALTTARTISSEKHQTLYINAQGVDEDYYKDLRKKLSSFPIVVFVHENNKLSAPATQLFSDAIISLAQLQILKLDETELDDAFYESIASFRIQTLCLTNLQGPSSRPDREASRSLARSVMSMHSLRRLMLLFNRLDDEFFKTMADTASQSKLEKLGLAMYDGMQLSTEASGNYVKGLSSLRNLSGFRISTGLLHENSFSDFSSFCSSSQIDGLMFIIEDMSADPDVLVKGVASIPYLDKLCVVDGTKENGSLFENCCSKLAQYVPNTEVEISAINLEYGQLTPETLEAILSLQTLRGIRFTSVKIKEDEIPPGTDLGQNSGSAQHVTELRIDDQSLSHLRKFRLHARCTGVERLQLDFTDDVTNDAIQYLREFPTITNLFIEAHKSWHQPLKKVSLPDTSELRGALMAEGWPQLESLVITDISIGDQKAKEILTTITPLGRPTKTKMTWCETTDALDIYLSKHGPPGNMVVRMTHGKPTLAGDIDDEEQFCEYLGRTDSCFFDEL